MSHNAGSHSVNFALLMARLAHRPNLLWYKHEISPFPDDDPKKRRHLGIKIQVDGYFDMLAECFVHSNGGLWTNGSVVIGFYGDDRHIYKHDPERFFEYNRMGMREIRRVPVQIFNTQLGFTACALDDPDIVPSLRDRPMNPHKQGPSKNLSDSIAPKIAEKSLAFRQLPQANGVSEEEALGALIMKNPNLFQVVLRDQDGQELPTNNP